jgi:hypothetical protein
MRSELGHQLAIGDAIRGFADQAMRFGHGIHCHVELNIARFQFAEKRTSVADAGLRSLFIDSATALEFDAWLGKGGPIVVDYLKAQFPGSRHLFGFQGSIGMQQTLTAQPAAHAKLGGRVLPGRHGRAG